MNLWLLAALILTCSDDARATTEDSLSGSNTSQRCPTVDECRQVNRQSCPDPVQGYCGPCLPSYVEKHGSCFATEASPVRVGSCPDRAQCQADYRLPCTWHTAGKCGSCLSDYIDVEGICIQSGAAAELLQLIEEDILHRQAASGPVKSAAISSENAAGADVQALGMDQQIEKKVSKDPSDVRLNGDTAGNPFVAPQPMASLNSSDTERHDAMHAAGYAQSSHGAVRPAELSQLLSIVIVLVAAVLAVIALTTASVCWYRLMKRRLHRKQQDLSSSSSSASVSVSPHDEPWIRPVGTTAASLRPAPTASFDKKLAQSALMYHFEHSKHQIVTRQNRTLVREDAESTDSEDDGEACGDERGGYTVYECPGLAPTSDMEVNNPIFDSAVRKSSSLESTSSSGVASPAEDRNK